MNLVSIVSIVCSIISLLALLFCFFYAQDLLNMWIVIAGLNILAVFIRSIAMAIED